MSKSDKTYKFFYVTKTVKQPSLFAGMPDVPKQEVLGVYHIVKGGRIMCGESREVIRNKEHAEATKEVDTRPRNVQCCAGCEEAWRSDPDSGWYKFAHGKPSAVVGINLDGKTDV